jgi:pimeloyl-ACP methyl ester carboxylesterase
MPNFVLTAVFHASRDDSKAKKPKIPTAERQNFNCRELSRLKEIDVPTLILHGDDDQIVPIADSSLLSVKLLKNSTLKVYPGFSHGMCTTNPEQINMDLLTFVQQTKQASA